MRKFYWYLTAFAKKYGLILIGSLVGAIIIFSFLLPLILKKVSIKKRQYIGVVGEYTLNSLPRDIKKVLSVGLTEINEDKTISPLLSERWSVEDEGKTYRFIIKKDITWQDGKPLEPADIKYNFHDVETLTTPNDVIFKLPDSFSPFPSVVTEPIFRQSDQKYLLFFTRPTLIGIGSHKILSYKIKAGRLEEIVIDSPKERLIYRFYLTENDAINAFKKGEVDILPDVSSEKNIVNWSSVTASKKLQSNRYLAVLFNNSQPIFAKNIRQALSYALEKTQGKERAIGPIDPNSWAFLEGGKTYEKDLKRAIERLLDGLPPEKMEMELTTTSIFTSEAETIKQQWETFGVSAFEACNKSKDIENKDLCENIKIKVNIKVTNFPDTSNYQLLLIGQESPPDPDQYFLWHSEQPTNLTKYKNTRIDSLLEKGRQVTEQKERLAIYQEFQQFLLEDPPVIFLRHLESWEIERK